MLKRLFSQGKPRRVDALSIKEGPTESGEVPDPAVGGEMFPIDKLSVFLTNFWFLIILILLFPLAVLFYKKRKVASKFIIPLFYRFMEYRRTF